MNNISSPNYPPVSEHASPLMLYTGAEVAFALYEMHPNTTLVVNLGDEHSPVGVSNVKRIERVGGDKATTAVDPRFLVRCSLGADGEKPAPATVIIEADDKPCRPGTTFVYAFDDEA